MKRSVLLLLPLGLTLLSAQEKFVPNYDESVAAKYPVPDVLTALDGSRIATVDEWQQKRRPELLGLYASEVYGKTPQKEIPVRHETLAEDKEVYGGKGLMRQVALHIGEGDKALEAHLLIYLPKSALTKPVPVFSLLNFWGNHAVSSDPDIVLNSGWFRDSKEKGIVDHKATEASRGNSESRYPVESILDRGYALATMYYGDIDPDFDDGFANGLQPLFYEVGQTRPKPDEWGSIGAWAWGLSRIADYLVAQPEFDKDKLAVLGHSRLGKTALWAGAQDERFGIVISNNSGEGGAALSTRNYGETVWRLNTSFPHWFCGNYTKYSNNEGALPMDQNALIALMAPRPVYIASATEDQWADPKGEFLSGKLAEPVYALFGKEGLGVEEQPAPDTPVGGTIGYHLRTGKHDLEAYDWERFMDFADKHWRP